MYKVFNENNYLRILSTKKNFSETQPSFIFSNRDDSLKEYVARFIENQLQSDWNVLSKLSPHDFFKKLIPDIKYVEAAGGIVKDKNNAFLFFRKNNHWDLPKGHIDAHENVEQTAIREVFEETGISNTTIIRPLAPTWHCYMFWEKPYLKKTYWFEMIALDTETLIPDKSEGISEPRWINEKGISRILQNSYPSIAELFKNFYPSLIP